MKIYLYEKGVKKVLAIHNGVGGGGTTRELEVLAILMAGAKSFHPLRRGCKSFSFPFFFFFF